MKHPQKEQTKGIYLLLGENEFEKSQFLKDLIQNFSLGRQVEVSYIDDSNENAFQEFVKMLSSSSLFGSSKVVVVKNVDKVFSKSEKSKVIDLLKRFRDEDILIVMTSSLYSHKFDKSIYSFVEQYGVVKVFGKIFDFALSKYVSDLLSKNSIEVRKDLIEFIIERNGQNVNGIAEDINYVRNYFNLGEFVEADKAIDLLLNKSGEGNIFDLLNALIKGDKHRAILVLNELVDRGEDIQSLPSIIYSQVRKIVKVKRLLGSNFSDDEICKQVGITSFELRNLKALSKNVDKDRIVSLLKFSLEVESSLRSYSVTVMLANIERFIIQMF